MYNLEMGFMWALNIFLYSHLALKLVCTQNTFLTHLPLGGNYQNSEPAPTPDL